jgi:hypothetical protein
MSKLSLVCHCLRREQLRLIIMQNTVLMVLLMRQPNPKRIQVMSILQTWWSRTTGTPQNQYGYTLCCGFTQLVLGPGAMLAKPMLRISRCARLAVDPVSRNAPSAPTSFGCRKTGGRSTDRSGVWAPPWPRGQPWACAGHRRYIAHNTCRHAYG